MDERLLKGYLQTALSMKLYTGDLLKAAENFLRCPRDRKFGIVPKVLYSQEL